VNRLLVVTIAAAALVGSGAVTAWATGSSSGPSPQSGHPSPAAGAGDSVDTPATPLDSATQLTYTPIAPCRAVNTGATGAGGAMASGARRAFTIGGTATLHAQGGPTTGCGIPTQASAVSATISVVATGKGYVKAWAVGATEPGTAFMDYTNVYNASTGGVVSLGSGRIYVRNQGAVARIYVDVTGYYMTPMTAFVSSNGTLTRGSRVTSVTKLTAFGNGVYQVTFDRDVSDCTYAANNYNYTSGVLLEPRSGVPDAVYVETVNGSQDLTDSNFFLTVTC
jgi:hypothetical protein